MIIKYSLVVWLRLITGGCVDILAQIYERTHAEMTSPHEYYAAVGAQPMPLIGAEGGIQPAMMPTGVLRKQGLCLRTYFLTVSPAFIGVMMRI